MTCPVNVEEPAHAPRKVCLLFAADTLNCVFDLWWIYDILINHFGQLRILLSSTGEDLCTRYSRHRCFEDRKLG